MKEFNIDSCDIFCITSNIKEKFGGMTNSIFRRARIFGDLKGIPVKIITFKDDFNLRRNINKYNLSKVGNNTTIINMFEFYSEEEFEHEDIILENKFEVGELQIKDPKKNIYKIFKDGIYSKLKVFNDENTKIKYIDYFDECIIRTKRELYDECGYLRKTIFYDKSLNMAKQVLYHRKDKSIFLNQCYKYDTINEINCIDKIFHISKSQIISEYNSIEELEHNFLKEITQNKLHNFFIIDSKAKMDMMMKYNSSNYDYKIYFMHSSHSAELQEREDGVLKGKIKNKFKGVFSKINTHDSIVVLTNEQKKDLIARYGNIDNISVIPHSYSGNVSNNEFSNRNLKRIIAVARFDYVKQHDHMIKAMKEVVKIIPDAVLDLYGFGEEEENIKKLINDLNLNNNVFVKGFSNDIEHEFRTSAISLLTSKFEGQSLVILESLACGCPVISYATKYGPRDMIQDNINGKLIEYNNINALSEAIIELLNNPKKIEILSNNSSIILENYNDNKFMENWITLFNELMTTRESKKIFKSIKPEFYSYNYNEKKNAGVVIVRFKNNKTILNEETINKLKLTLENRVTKDRINILGKIKERNKEFILLEYEINFKELINKGDFEKCYLDIYISYLNENKYISKRLPFNSTALKYEHTIGKFKISCYKTINSNLSIRVY